MRTRPAPLPPPAANPAPAPRPHPGRRGSILIIVLWVAFGLVTIALYFAQTMGFELRASDNRVAALEAAQAAAGAARYASNILASLEEPGFPPDPMEHETAALPIGEARAWFLGRDPAQGLLDEPAFGLVDEASKLNLNTATVEMLQWLPRMTPELAAAIVDWRDTDSEVTTGGAEDETYQRLNPPYRCKNAPFESLEELGLVANMDLEILYGEDTNLNGVVDPNENDGEATPPFFDNRDGRVDPGILEYLTVFSREPNTRSDGSARINVGGTNQTELASLLQERFGTDRANGILQQIGVPAGGAPGGGGPGSGGPGGGAPGAGGPGGGGNTGPGPGAAATTYRSLLEFYTRSGMTADEFAQVEGDLTVSTNLVTEGLVNVNTASETVLACIPGIGLENAGTLVARRRSNPADEHSLAWVSEVLDAEAVTQAGPYLTGRSYQYTADIAALGHHGRGYQRIRFLFDTSTGVPRLVRRQDLTHLGWALGSEVREEYLRAREAGESPFGGRGMLSVLSSR